MPQDYFDEQSSPSAQPDKSIRNIPISTNRPAPAPRPRIPMGDSRRSRRLFTRIVLPLLGLAVVGVAAMSFAAIARGTTVVITPRTHTVVFDETSRYTAYPKETAEPGQLAYAYEVYEESAEKTVPSSGTEKVEEFAKGTVTIYNDHDTKPVRLIANTRFESPNGLVYRIKGAVVIPGKKTGAPGTLTATVYADKPGDQYNIGPVERFTLPGLKDSAPDMYPNIYAKSADAMKGGYAGERPIVSDKDLAQAKKDLEADVRAKLDAKVAAAQGTGDIRFPQMATVSLSPATPEKRDGSVVVKMSGTARIPYFESIPFATTLATLTSAQVGDRPVSFKDMGSFTVIPAEATSTATVKEGSPITFGITGSGTFIWEVKPEAFASELAGKSASMFKTVLEAHPEIAEGSARIRPFWKKTFPSETESIHVTVTEAK